MPEGKWEKVREAVDRAGTFTNDKTSSGDVNSVGAQQRREKEGWGKQGKEWKS